MRHKIFQIMVLISFLIIMTATIPLGYAYEWSPDMELTWHDNIDGSPSIAQASDGKIWVVWNSYRTGNLEIFYKVYDSSKVHPWSSEKNLTYNLNADISPAIMQAQDGKIWVVWSTNRDGNYEIYYKTSQDNGATWSWPEKNLTYNPKADEYPSIMQTTNGTIWLAWSANRTGNYEIYYKTSQDNGATWLTDKVLSHDHLLETTDDRNPSITQTADGKIYFVWVRNKDQDGDGDPDLNIWYKTYSYNPMYSRWEWSTSINQVTQDLDVLNGNPSITQTKDGKILVVWNSDKIGNQADLYYKRILSAEPITQLTINQGGDFAPSIMQAADGTIWIVWAAYRADNFDIYYMTTDGVWINGFTQASGWTGWTRVGSSPWLSAADYNINYINTSVADDKIGNFTFQDLPTGIVWSTVTLRLKTWQSGGDGNDYINIYLYDGSTWTTTPYTVTPSSTAAPGNYSEIDVSSFLNTAAKINAAKMRLEKIQVGTPDTIGVDHAFISLLPRHDVAIFSVIPTEVTVTQGQTVPIEFVAQNHGMNDERNLIVRLYADSTLINATTIASLPSGELWRMTYTWNVLNTGTYKIWANVSVVNGEIYILNNFFPALLGDVNGDRTVNESDLSALNNAYGLKPGDLNWNPNCDFYVDSKVDAYDLLDLSKNFGSSQ